MTKPLAGKICLVTGGSRGLGRGIALQLGAAGATVYVTGRTLKSVDNKLGSLEDAAKDIELRGGLCIPVQCDHTNDGQVVDVFNRIKREQSGQLDILINNAYAAVNSISESMGKPFWECDDNMWDDVNNVGMRNHYQCTVHAARMMAPRKQGLIVNISSPGGLRYLFNVPYGVGKAAVDRMAVDCAIELRKHKVAMVSLWPGPVKTELVGEMLDQAERVVKENPKAEKFLDNFKDAESAEFSGKVIAALAQDPKLMSKSGRILLAADLAREYNIRDIDGRRIDSIRNVAHLLRMYGWKRTAGFMPEFLHIPFLTLALIGSKF